MRGHSEHSQNEDQSSSWLRSGNICGGTSAAAGRLPNMGSPDVVINLRIDRSHTFPPNDVVGAVHDAVAVVVPGCLVRFNNEQRLVYGDVEQTLDDSAWPLNRYHVDGV